MLTKTHIRKSPQVNVVVVTLPKNCEMWVIPSNSQGPESELENGKPLEVCFGATFKESMSFEESDYVPVKFEPRLMGKSIVIDARCDEYGRDFPIMPTKFRIILPAGCALCTDPT